MEERFRIRQDAQGNPVYEYGNQIVSKEEFDQKNKRSNEEGSAMRSAISAGIDDDPDMMAMKEKANAILAAKKPIKKAKGGTVSSASKRGDGIAQRGKTRGKMC